jgi:hypothetical protein
MLTRRGGDALEAENALRKHGEPISTLSGPSRKFGE